MKKVIFAGFIISLIWAFIWQFGYMSLFDMGDLDQKTYIITANLKWIAAYALYIAWRVTPESKNQPLSST